MSASRFMRTIFGVAALCVASLSGLSGAQARAPDPAYAKQQQATISQMRSHLAKSAETRIKLDDVETCYSCHKDIREFHMGSKHAGVNCAHCHTGSEEHLKRDGKHLTPTQASIGTRTDHAACGTCHAEQTNSFLAMNYDSHAKVEKAHPRSVSPMFDKLMQSHGFTREHAEPRSHVFMLLDHLLVDRAYGGRFQLRDWTFISDAKGTATSLWDTVLVDLEPGTNVQKRFLAQTATAANPVCMNCKTQDTILKWRYMGDPDPRAKWDRTSNVVEFARDVKHPMNCYACHDPHSGAPRVVRDALIQAVVDRGEGTYPYDKEKSQQITMKKVEFRNGFRAIGLLSKSDSNLMCGQCHVEYNCNTGIEPNANPDGTDKPVTMADRRTNLFQWVNVFDYNQAMREKHGNFKDFRHAVTGTALSKIQHPELEVYWMSKHEREGVECKDCHMPRVERNGVSFTDHQQRSPRFMLEETCVRCHGDMTVKQARYQIDAIQAYTRGKIIKAEFWLARFIDTFVRARDLGVPLNSAAIRQARKHHDEAHTLWEWWTAENSVGFHNPQQARDSLTRSMNESQAGIKVLEDAIVALRK